MKESNTIGKEIIEMHFTGKTDTFALQQSSNDWCTQKLLPAIEKKLERFAGLSDVIRIDKIAVDYNTRDQLLNESLAEKIAEEIEARIESKIARSKVALEGEARVFTKEESYFDTLIFFLTNGYFPWHSKIASVSDFKEMLNSISGTPPGSNQVLQVKEVLLQSPVQQRLLGNSDSQLLQLTLSLILPDQKLQVQAFITQLHSLSFLIQSLPERKQFVQTALRFFIAEIVQQAGSNTTSAGLRYIITALVLHHAVTKPQLLYHLQQHGFMQTTNVLKLPTDVINWIMQQELQNDENASSKEKNNKEEDEKTINDSAVEQPFEDEAAKPLTTNKNDQHSATESDERNNAIVTDNDSISNHAGQKTSVDNNSEQVKADETQLPLADQQSPQATEQQQRQKRDQLRQKEEGIYISNAGLVIVVPFLSRLFENLGVSENGKLNSADLAVALMHFIATGMHEYAEFELVLPKIICGMQPEDNISIVAPLPQTFMDEAEEMLRSLISHWSILKDTSTEGLRQSFLVRDGKLSFKNNEWHLQVEQKPYDMLLQQLPWNISMLKLSWMPHVLKTDWT